MEAGVDSLGIVEIRNALNLRVAIEMTPTTIIDYPTITALSTYLADGSDGFCDYQVYVIWRQEAAPDQILRGQVSHHSQSAWSGFASCDCWGNCCTLPLHMLPDLICSGAQWGNWRSHNLHFCHCCHTTYFIRRGVDHRYISTSAFGTMGYRRCAKGLDNCTRSTFWMLSCKCRCIWCRCLLNLEVLSKLASSCLAWSSRPWLMMENKQGGYQKSYEGSSNHILLYISQWSAPKCRRPPPILQDGGNLYGSPTTATTRRLLGGFTIDKASRNPWHKCYSWHWNRWLHINVLSSGSGHLCRYRCILKWYLLSKIHCPFLAFHI